MEIIISANAEQIEIDSLAIVKGYEPTKEVDTVVEMTVVEATEKGYKMTILEDNTMCSAITETNEIANEQSAEDYLQTHYQTIIENDMTKEFIALWEKELKEAREVEDKEIRDRVEGRIKIVFAKTI